MSRVKQFGRGGLRPLRAALLALTLSAAFTSAHAQGPAGASCQTVEIANPPQFAGRVTDAANMFPAEQAAELVKISEGLQARTGVQLAIVTIDTLDGVSIADYACTLAVGWQIGDAERKDGIVILVAKKERQARVSVGSGLTDKLTEQAMAEAMQANLIPYFKSGEHAAGIAATIGAIAIQLGVTAES